MAARITFGGNGQLFVGEDKTVEFEILDTRGLPVDITGWSLRLVVKSQANTVLIDKNATITGTYNVDRVTNTQRAVVTLTDDDLSIDDGVHQYSLKRTDSGSETVLVYTECIVERTTQA
jgi:hypothetical protein